MQVILDQIDRAMAMVLGNTYVSTALTLFLILYAGLAAPKLPPFIASLFESSIFKLLIMFLILIVRNYDPTVSLLMTIGFALSIQALNRYRMFGMANDLGNALEARGEARGELREEDSQSIVGENVERDAPQPMMSSAKLTGACCPMSDIYDNCGSCGMSMSGGMVGGGCGCPVSAVAYAGDATTDGTVIDAEAIATEDKVEAMDAMAGVMAGAEEDLSMSYDRFGFMGCDKPQPQAVDLVLPPQPEVPTEVSVILNQNCQHQGPQGMQHPQGYSGTVYGANY